MTKELKLDDPFRLGKAYSVGEAARLASTSSQNVRRWMLGYDAPGHRMEPVFGNKRNSGESLTISFLELAEIIIVAGFRKQRVPLQRAREAHEYARMTFHLDYPFASLNLRESGGHILHEFEQQHPGTGKLVSLDLRGQYVLSETVQMTVVNFDFSVTDRLVLRWFPFGRDVPVVVDPHFGAGAPTVLGSRVKVDTLMKRWKAGETIKSMSSDLELAEADIEHVLQRAA